MSRLATIFTLALPVLCACGASLDMADAARQALADGRASQVAVGGPAPPPRALPDPREPARIRPLLAETLPAAGEIRAPAAPVIPAGAWPRATSATPLPAPPSGMPLPASAAGLAGNAPDRILEWLGEPTLRRVEGTAAIWLYAAAGCQLDVMFYPSAPAAGGGLRVAHVQARAGGFAQRTEAACLRDLAAQARRRPSHGQGGARQPDNAPSVHAPVDHFSLDHFLLGYSPLGHSPLGHSPLGHFLLGHFPLGHTFRAAADA